jgi:hypothetical protein
MQTVELARQVKTSCVLRRYPISAATGIITVEVYGNSPRVWPRVLSKLINVAAANMPLLTAGH